MGKVEILNLVTLFLTMLAIVPKTESIMPIVPTNPRPLCASQFALVNYACSRLPFTPGVPPSHPSPDEEGDHEHGHQHEHKHEHRLRHGHKHRHHMTVDEENCCRWAKEMDSECVCELLVRLPPFLVKPAHRYTLNIGESCDVTFSCGGPI